jgi:hypothetical protein
MIFAHDRQLVKPKDAERYWDITPATTEKQPNNEFLPTKSGYGHFELV